jgi:hypothetical protein
MEPGSDSPATFRERAIDHPANSRGNIPQSIKRTITKIRTTREIFSLSLSE